MDIQSGAFVFGWDESAAQKLTTAAAPAALPTARRRNPALEFRDLPNPTGVYPFQLNLSDVLGNDAIAEIEQEGKFSFHTVGDTGQKGHGGAAQDAIAHHMSAQAVLALGTKRARFFYHLGDIVYYNGALYSYEPQFYEPYKNYGGPIFGIPGNHDGDVPRGDKPLQGFMENFCTPTPVHSEWAGESPRTTMTQPHCYWSLRMPFGRVIGLYSNVKGNLDRNDTVQRDWLAEQLKDAGKDEWVIVAVHHPPYSRDTSHGGYPQIGGEIDAAITTSKRSPDLVLCGHVHSYQRFERDVSEFGGRRILNYVTAGAGGFAGFDGMHKVDTGDRLPQGVKAEKYADELPGFLRLTVSKTEILGEYYTVARPPNHFKKDAQLNDTFRIAKS